MQHHEQLLKRLLAATGAGSVGLALAAACGGQDTGVATTRDVGGHGSGGAGTGGASSNSGAAGSGAAGAIGLAGGAPSVGGTSSGGVIVHVDGGVPPGVRVNEVCFATSLDSGVDAGCFADNQTVIAAVQPQLRESCLPEGFSIVEVLPVPSTCCYSVRYGCYTYVGRAFLTDEGLVKAGVRTGAQWLTGDAPDVSALSPATRRALMDAWIKDALFEHASVATFARFALQLLAVGAPASLLHETLAAGNDEVRHAELCFGLASVYAGEALGPDEFPIGEDVKIARDLLEIVEETIVEGCIGETMAALQAAEQLRWASDPAVVKALTATIEDETRHAELAWRVVAWALRVGGAPVRRLTERTFAEFRPPDAPVIDLEGVDLDHFEAHGRLLPAETRRVALDALDRIVRPCAAALLGVDVRGFQPVSMAMAV